MAQDGVEVWIIIAIYEPGYEKYLSNIEVDAKEQRYFLTMQEYGPWKIGDHEKMKLIVPLLLAFGKGLLEHDTEKAPKNPGKDMFPAVLKSGGKKNK